MLRNGLGFAIRFLKKNNFLLNYDYYDYDYDYYSYYFLKANEKFLLQRKKE